MRSGNASGSTSAEAIPCRQQRHRRRSSRALRRRVLPGTVMAISGSSRVCSWPSIVPASCPPRGTSCGTCFSKCATATGYARTMTLPTEPIGGASLVRRPSSTACRRPPPGGSRPGCVRRPVRRRRGRHAASVGDGPTVVTTRAAQAELRDLSGRRPAGLAPGGVVIPFEDGHTRQLPMLTSGPFRYATKAGRISTARRGHDPAQLEAGGHLRVRAQPDVPGGRDPGYPREAFLDDLVAEAVAEIRGCLERGAIVQIDFTEARLSLKLDPSKGLLNAFVDLNNRVLGGSPRTSAPGRRPHLSRWRPGLDPQRRHRLRRAAARACSA